MVSAYQKCVRRGLTDRALWLVGGFLSFDRKEISYFWRRICTTVAEDVGYGDPELMNFVVACSMQYGSIKTPKEILHHVWSFLTEQMAETQKSRIYCQLAIVEESIRTRHLPEHLDPWELGIVSLVGRRSDADAKAAWATKNNWRCERMLAFQHIKFPDAQKKIDREPGEHRMIGNLPDFAYDMHTRVGLAVCLRLCGHRSIKQFFAEDPLSQSKKKAVGLALFFAEGALIQDGLADRGLTQASPSSAPADKPLLTDGNRSRTLRVGTSSAVGRRCSADRLGAPKSSRTPRRIRR